MVGTRDLHRVLALAERDGAQVVLVGDPRQLPEIEAGGAFAALARRLGASELVGNRRQAEGWERDALAQLRSGEARGALAALEAHGRIHTGPTMADARRRLVDDWLEARVGAGELRMLAATRREVDELNRLARSSLAESGMLGSVVARTAGGCEFALGDEVVCLRNDRRIGVVNGTRGVVVGTADGGVTLRVGTAVQHVPQAYLAEGRLAHGYATTIHKSQGDTVDRAFVLGTDSLHRESGYVALSRARVRTDLYVAEETLDEGRTPDDPHGTARPRRSEDDLIRTFTRSDAKRLALDLVVEGGSHERLPEPHVRQRIRRFGPPFFGLER